VEEEDRRDEINREESEEMDVLVIVLVVGLLSNNSIYLNSAALKDFVSIARRNEKTNSGREREKREKLFLLTFS